MVIIDPMSRTPIYEQLIAQVEKLLLCGALKPGQALPSVRAMSVRLSVNPNTVQRAYSDLCQQGIVMAVPGKGCFIANQARERLTAKNEKRLAAFADSVRALRQTGMEKDALLCAVEAVYEERGEGDAAGREFA